MHSEWKNLDKDHDVGFFVFFVFWIGYEANHDVSSMMQPVSD